MNCKQPLNPPIAKAEGKKTRFPAHQTKTRNNRRKTMKEQNSQPARVRIRISRRTRAHHPHEHQRPQRARAKQGAARRHNEPLQQSLPLLGGRRRISPSKTAARITLEKNRPSGRFLAASGHKRLESRSNPTALQQRQFPRKA